MNNFNLKDWINLGRWVQPPISGCFWCYWNETRSTYETTRMKFNNMAYLDGYTLEKKVDQKRIEELVKSIYVKKKVGKFTNHFERICGKYEKQHLAILNNSPENLKDYLGTLFSTYQELLGLRTLSIFLGDAIQKYLLDNHLAAAEDLLEAQKFNKKTWLEQQNIEIGYFTKQWLKLAKKNQKVSVVLLKKYPNFFSKIKEHVKKYVWYGTHHWVGDGYDLEKCLKDINDKIERGDFKIHNYHQKKKLPEIIKLLNACAYWRTHCAEITVKVVFLSRPMLARAAKKFGLSYDGLTLLSAKEIIDGIKKGDRNLLFGFGQRKKGYGCFLQKNKEIILTGIVLNRLLNKIAGKSVKGIKEFKGLVACQGGIIKGRVRKIIAPEDVKKFKKGEILVATETTPDFVPAMKMAMAIITDRGGITSHAAIVSREMGTPCIIGTEIATKVLKDGDLVEIDASKGIIRKL